MKLKNIFKAATLCLACLLSAFYMERTAHADMIYEPEDDFYESHYDQCKVVARSYIATGEGETVSLYEKPDSQVITASFDNGTVCYVSMSYTDSNGKEWGLADFNYGYSDPPFDVSIGWVNMDEFTLKYDGISFWEEHEKEFTDYGNELENYKIQKQIYVWTYPGSNEICGTIKGTINQTMWRPACLYTDPLGNQWVYLNYYFGTKGWINATSPEEGPKTATASVPGNPQPAKGLSVHSVVTGLVILLIAFTIALIRIFWDKKRS